MNIGEQILDQIIHDGLVRAEFINGNTLFIWQGNAAEQIEAMVESRYDQRPVPCAPEKIATNILACLDSKDRLSKLSAKELVDAVLVVELMNRVLPGWENLP